MAWSSAKKNEVVGSCRYGCFQKLGEKTPKWMVKIMENPMKMDDLGIPLFFGNTGILTCIWINCVVMSPQLPPEQDPLVHKVPSTLDGSNAKKGCL